MRLPSGAAIGRSPQRSLKDRILSSHKPYAWTQHMSSKESRIKKSSLTDLPRSSRVSGIKDGVRTAAQNSVCPTKEDGSKRILHAARHALPHRPSVGGM